MASCTVLEKPVGSQAIAADFLHGDSCHEKTPFMSILKKDNVSHQRVMTEYLTHWVNDVRGKEDTDEMRKKREFEYMSLVNKYVLLSRNCSPRSLFFTSLPERTFADC